MVFHGLKVNSTVFTFSNSKREKDCETVFTYGTTLTFGMDKINEGMSCKTEIQKSVSIVLSTFFWATDHDNGRFADVRSCAYLLMKKLRDWPPKILRRI